MKYCLLLSALALGCKHSAKVPDSKLTHELGEIAANVPSFGWSQANINNIGNIPDTFLPPDQKVFAFDHPMTKLLQSMTNKIDAVARQTNPEIFDNIPKPVMVLADSMDTNGFVSPTSLCVKYPVLRADKETSSSTVAQQSNGVLDLRQKGVVYMTTTVGEGGFSKCEDFPDGKTFDIDTFIRKFNDRLAATGNANCKIGATANAIIISDNSSCGYTGGGSFDSFLFDQQSNLIYIFRGAVENLSQTAVASLIAHELAHYYRGHLGTLTKLVPYFFIQSRQSDLSRPTKTERYPNLQYTLKRYSELNFQKLDRDFDYNINSLWRLVSIGRSFANDYCKRKSCSNSLITYLDTNGESLSSITDKIGYYPISNEEQMILNNYLAKFDEFANQIAMSDLEKADVDHIRESFSGWVEDFNVSPENFQTLSQFVKAVDQKFANALQHSRELHEEAASVGLGFYTSEEEADEIAAELAARSGLTEMEFLSLPIELMQIDLKKGNNGSFLETPYRECLELFSQMSPDQPFDSIKHHVRFDSLENYHHGLCYRLFNSAKEWHYHGLDSLVNSENRPILAEDDWNTALESLDSKVSLLLKEAFRNKSF